MGTSRNTAFCILDWRRGSVECHGYLVSCLGYGSFVLGGDGAILGSSGVDLNSFVM